MEDRKYKVDLYLYDRPLIINPIEFYQNDTESCAIEFNFNIDRVSKFDLTNKTVEVRVTKPDLTTITDSATITGLNTAVWELKLGAISVAGSCSISIYVYENTERLTFGTLKYKVISDREVGNVVSQPEYPILTQLIADTQAAVAESNQTNDNISVMEQQRTTNEQLRQQNETTRNSEFNNIKNEYSSIKGIMLDTNNAADLQDQVNQVNTQLEDIAYNVKSFGAKGDGITDDTVAIQNAINKATTDNKILLLPTGLSFNCSILNVTCNIIGRGNSKLIIQRLNIKSNGITLSDFNIYAKDYCAIGIDGVTEQHYKDIVLKNIKLTYDSVVTTNWLFVRGQYVDNLTIQNCNSTIGGIQLVQCDNFEIKDNRIDGKWVNTNEAIHISQFSKGIIDGNTILNVNEAMDLYTSGERCIITNNRIIGINTRGLELKVTLRDAPYTGGSSDQQGYTECTIISGNLIKDIRPTVAGEICSGISVIYVDNRAIPSFEIAKTQRGLIITDNIIEDFYATYNASVGIAYFSGVVIEGHNCIISNNVFRNIHTHGQNLFDTCGIKLSSNVNYTCKGIVIDGNVISGSEGTGIDVKHAENCVISNNIIRKDEVTGLTPKYGIRILDGTLKNTRIANNLIESNVTNSVGIYGAVSSGSTIIEKNIIIANTLIDCGMNIPYANECIISNNIITNDLNSVGIAIGHSSLIGLGNKIINNSITVSDDYSIQITYQKGFLIEGNYTKDAGTSSILVTGANIDGITTYGLILNNLSYSQNGVDVIRYLNVTANDLATIAASNNIKFN